MFGIKTIDRMDDYTQWTVLSNDTDNLTESAARVTGLKSLSFDKVDGAANGTGAGASRGVKVNLDEEAVQLHDKVQWAIYISALTNVASCYIKLGTDSSNNMQWTIADTVLRTGWTVCTGVIGEPSAINGNGWDPTNIIYMEVGVTFDGETNALADMLVDSVSIIPSRYTEDNTEITMDGISVEANLDALEALVTLGNVDLAALEVLLTASNVDLAALEVLLVTIDADTSALELLIKTHGATAALKSLLIGGMYELVPSELTDGQQGPPGLTAWKFVKMAGYDEAQNLQQTQDATTLSGIPFTPGAQTTLTAPGDGKVENTYGRSNHTWAVTVVLNTCTNVVVAVHGALADSGYGNIEGSNPPVNTTLTADGVYFLTASEVPFKFLKPVFVSEATDTDSTVTFEYMGAN